MTEIHEITVYPDGAIDGLFSVRQYDSLSHTLQFVFQQNMISGDAAQLRVQPAGKNEPYLYPCTVAGALVTVTPNNSAWQAPGFASCQLEITSAGEVIWQTNVFPIKVIRSLDETGGMTPEEGQTLVDQLEAARDEALTAASAANEAAEKAQIVKILGTYATLDDLEQAIENPSQGDHYNIGTAAPYTVYMWDETEPPGDWISQGQLQGAPGPQGPAGPNEVTTSTATTITGMLKGIGAAIAQAVSGTDYAPPSQSITATLTATGWADNAQTLTVSSVTATSNGLLRISQTATPEQFSAWSAALPRITAQAADSVTVTIAGTVPTVDIPVEVVIL